MCYFIALLCDKTLAVCVVQGYDFRDVLHVKMLLPKLPVDIEQMCSFHPSAFGLQRTLLMIISGLAVFIVS